MVQQARTARTRGPVLRGLSRLAIATLTLVAVAGLAATPAHATAAGTNSARTGGLAGQPAGATAQGGGRFVAAYIQSTDGRDLCLDVTNFDYRDGTYVQDWPCTGAANQSWIVQFNSQGKAVIQSAGNRNFCLDMMGDVNGIVRIWSCHSTPNQLWNFADLGNGSSMWGSTNNGTTCLAVDFFVYGVPLSQEPCAEGAANEIWKG